MAHPFSHLEDTKLMLMYQAGDHMAFEVIYNRHKDKVFSYLSSRLHKKDDIEDLYQLVFVKFHKSRHLYQEKFALLPWLYTITKSEFLDFIKKKRINTSEFNELMHSEAEQVAQNDFFDLSAEKELTQKEKEAIEMRYFKESDFLEISHSLKTTESNARKIISRGIKKLRNKYNGVKS